VDFEAASGRAWLRGTSLGRAASLGARAGGPDAKDPCARAARRHGLVGIVWTGPVRAIETQIFATKVHQVMNWKVVDLTTLYNFHKGSRVFFSMDFAGTSCQL
jgi:hypothetical protein